MYDLRGKRVWVAGHRGLVGSSLVRRLGHEPISELITATSAQVDLRRQSDTEEFVSATQPSVVFLAAARVGGIQANRTRQGEFLYENLMIAANVVEAARRCGVQRTIVLGSSCVYPRDAVQPMREEALMNGPLEPTNEGYAIAKIAALELCKMYRRQYGMDAIALMPTNVYGPGDNFDLGTSHALAALLRKIDFAKRTGAPTVTVWGTGTPRREFLFVDDLADAAIHLSCCYADEQHINVGVGEDISITDLAGLIAEIVGWEGRFVYDTRMPDGVSRKLLDVSRLHATGWRARTGLRNGIEETYRWYCERLSAASSE